MSSRDTAGVAKNRTRRIGVTAESENLFGSNERRQKGPLYPLEAAELIGAGFR